MHGTYLLPCQPAAQCNSSAGRAGFYHRAFISMWYLRNRNVYVLEYEQQKTIFGYRSLQLLFCCIRTKHYKSWYLSYVKLLDFGFWVITNIAEVKFGAMHHWWWCHFKIEWPLDTSYSPFSHLSPFLPEVNNSILNPVLSCLPVTLQFRDTKWTRIFSGGHPKPAKWEKRE